MEFCGCLGCLAVTSNHQREKLRLIGSKKEPLERLFCFGFIWTTHMMPGRREIAKGSRSWWKDSVNFLWKRSTLEDFWLFMNFLPIIGSCRFLMLNDVIAPAACLGNKMHSRQLESHTEPLPSINRSNDVAERA